MAGQTARSLVRKSELQTDYSRAGCHRLWFFYLLALEMPGASTHIREGPTLDRDPQQILDIHKMNQCPVDQVRKAWRWVREVAAHIESAVKTQMNSAALLTFPFLFNPGPQPLEWISLHI